MNDKQKNKGGRPQKEIDWTQVEDWLAAGCTGAEVAACLGIASDTLYRRVVTELGYPTFSAYSQEKSAIGEKALRKKQQEVALKGNPSMLIWLGKNRLKQRDNDLTKELDQIKSDLAAYSQALKVQRESPEEQPADHIETLENKDDSQA